MKDDILELIYQALPTQKKKIENLFHSYPFAERDLESFLQTYKLFMDAEGISNEILANAYIQMVHQVIHCRLEFLRTGVYPANCQDTAFSDVYNNREIMTQYMLGLALSNFLWEQHYRMFNFYKKEIESIKSGQHFLEIGCGHGLFLIELLKNITKDSCVDVVDISQTSIDLSKNIVKIVNSKFLDIVRFERCDIFNYEAEKKYDFITMGEVLEHVEEPQEILKKTYEFLKDGGRLFITTCANAPAIDHVYHFKNIQEIRDMMSATGYRIEKELVAPSEKRSQEYLETHKVDISYAAILKKES